MEGLAGLLVSIAVGLPSGWVAALKNSVRQAASQSDCSRAGHRGLVASVAEIRSAALAGNFHDRDSNQIGLVFEPCALDSDLHGPRASRATVLGSGSKEQGQIQFPM